MGRRRLFAALGSPQFFHTLAGTWVSNPKIEQTVPWRRFFPDFSGE
jgi:hypothetical protein